MSETTLSNDFTDAEMALARDIWIEGSVGLASILRDHERLLKALRRIHDATGPADEGKPTSLGYVRQQAREALEFEHPLLQEPAR